MLEVFKAGKDKKLMGATILLMAVGLLMVYTSSAGLGASRFEGDVGHYFKHQALRALFAFVAMTVMMNLDYHRLQRKAPWVLIVALIALVALVVPGVGREVRGATRQIPGLPVQPSEFARFAVVLYLSSFLAKRGEAASFKQCIMPCFAVTLGAAGLVLLQPSLGSAVVLVLVSAVVLYVGGARLKHLAVVLGTGLAVAVACILSNPYQLERIRGFLGLGHQYQEDQSLLALGTGGVIGKGIGRSMQKYLFLPDPHTDFVFAIYGEETGFLGCVLLVSLFTFLLLRGLKVAASAPDRFGFLLATGLTASIGLFFAFNVGVVTGIIPTTGLPLPFISYGGSALLMNAVAVGVLLNISGHRVREGVSSGRSPWKRNVIRITEIR
ncbi:MAG: cell division protein FtsW [Candidatus Eisenbacteria bacterium]|nr:cell division protein FtsW [Candidatus Eisenbacteria bacterium]